MLKNSLIKMLNENNKITFYDKHIKICGKIFSVGSRQEVNFYSFLSVSLVGFIAYKVNHRFIFSFVCILMDKNNKSWKVKVGFGRWDFLDGKNHFA